MMALKWEAKRLPNIERVQLACATWRWSLSRPSIDGHFWRSLTSTTSLLPTPSGLNDIVGTMRRDAVGRLIAAAPDLANADPLSAEVRAWLDRAYKTVWRIDAVEASVLKLHSQGLHKAATRPVSSNEILETLRRVDRKVRLGLQREKKE